jgi:hypothetical protein
MIDPIERSNNQLDTQRWRIPMVEHDFQHVTWIAVLTAVCLTLVGVDDTYAQSPNRGKDEYIRGKDEYMRSCQPCHGTGGRGDGPTAKHLAKPPSDLTGPKDAVSSEMANVLARRRILELIE